MESREKEKVGVEKVIEMEMKRRDYKGGEEGEGLNKTRSEKV